MTPRNKIHYMKVALAIQHLHLKEDDIAKIIQTYEIIMSKKGEVTLKDISQIESNVEKEFNAKREKARSY